MHIFVLTRNAGCSLTLTRLTSVNDDYTLLEAKNDGAYNPRGGGGVSGDVADLWKFPFRISSEATAILSWTFRGVPQSLLENACQYI